MPFYTHFIEKMLLLEKYESLMLRPHGFVGINSLLALEVQCSL